MCELALARGEDAPAFHTLPVHPDYLRKPEPKFAATEVAAEEEGPAKTTEPHHGLPSSGATRHPPETLSVSLSPASGRRV
jgi:hypothetical protein